MFPLVHYFRRDREIERKDKHQQYFNVVCTTPFAPVLAYLCLESQVDFYNSILCEQKVNV